MQTLARKGCTKVAPISQWLGGNWELISACAWEADCSSFPGRQCSQVPAVGQWEKVNWKRNMHKLCMKQSGINIWMSRLSNMFPDHFWSMVTVYLGLLKTHLFEIWKQINKCECELLKFSPGWTETLNTVSEDFCNQDRGCLLVNIQEAKQQQNTSTKCSWPFFPKTNYIFSILSFNNGPFHFPVKHCKKIPWSVSDFHTVTSSSMTAKNLLLFCNFLIKSQVHSQTDPVDYIRQNTNVLNTKGHFLWHIWTKLFLR